MTPSSGQGRIPTARRPISGCSSPLQALQGSGAHGRPRIRWSKAGRSSTISTFSRLRPVRSRSGTLALTEIPFSAFDTETTGLRPAEGDEIISIGAVRIVNGRMLREEVFDQLIDPGRPIARESTLVHGIDDAMVQGQPGIPVVLPAFGRFIAGHRPRGA